MTDRKQQRERFREVLERKSQHARERSTAAPPQPEQGSAENVSPVQPSLIEHGRPQDVVSPRAKNSGKGKKTADKWNQ
ncbi:MAG TPA: hypothetical protein VGD00_06635 [Solirubrobacteraceae bacterium]|jgi:hypothetical protein